MKTKLLFIAASLLFFKATLYAQGLDEHSFDFWVGSWSVAWDEGEGKTGRGTNKVEKILDGTVLQENFRIEHGQNVGFKGTSISVFNSQEGAWYQAWADNQGGYFSFQGKKDGDKRIFQTRVENRNGDQVAQRMVFYDITPTGMTWDWESTTDGGATWSLSWRIRYTRTSE